MRKLHYLIKFLISVIVAVSFISAGTLEVAEAARATSGKVAAYRGVEHDWGYINIKGGNLQHTFSMYNSGEDNLLLKGGFTSCGCTNIVITLPDGSKSPEFGMTHSNTVKPANWIGIVKPGQSFKVTVEYDPLTHGPNALGPVERRAYIISSAPEDGLLSVRLPTVINGTVTILRVSGVVVSEEKFKQTSKADLPQKERVEVRIWAEIDEDLGPDAFKLKEHKD